MVKGPEGGPLSEAEIVQRAREGPSSEAEIVPRVRGECEWAARWASLSLSFPPNGKQAMGFRGLS